MRSLKQWILILGALFTLMAASAQSDEEVDELSAVKHAKRMKQGTLLVRLQTRENAILLLEVNGEEDRADRMWLDQKKQNEEIINAFTFIFDFCPVLFFFSYDSDKVRAGEYEGIFVNEQMQVDSSLTVDSDAPIYTAEIGDVYFETFSQHMRGGVFMTDQFKQLTKPFPYAVRKRAGLSLVKRTHTDLVKEMNDAVKKFYKRKVKGN